MILFYLAIGLICVLGNWVLVALGSASRFQGVQVTLAMILGVLIGRAVS